MGDAQSKRVWVNLLLLVLVFGLGLGAWWYQQRPVDRADTLLNLMPDDVVLITLERQPSQVDVPKIRFEKQLDTWYMVAPEKVAANALRIQQLLMLLDEPVSASYDAAGRDLTQYGLLPGRVTLRFNQQQLVLGEENSVSHQRYVLHNNQIKLVSEMIYGSVLSKWINFVSLQLIPPQQTVKAVKLPRHYLTPPALAANWQMASAIRLEPLPADTDLSAAEKVVVTLTDDTELVFWLLEKGEEWILAQPDSGIQYFIPAEQAHELWPVGTH